MDRILIIGIITTIFAAYGLTWIIFTGIKRVKHKMSEAALLKSLIIFSQLPRKKAKKLLNLILKSIKNLRNMGFSRFESDGILYELLYTTIEKHRKEIVVDKIVKETGMPLAEATRITRNWFSIGEDMQERGVSKEEMQYVLNGYYSLVVRAYLEGPYRG
jgi:excinuclease UvrABC ATPase subunit